jgi:TolA-binding protein
MNDVSGNLARARELLNLEPTPGAKARVLANVRAGTKRERRSPGRALIVAFALLGASTAGALGMPEVARWFLAPALPPAAASVPSGAPIRTPPLPPRHLAPSEGTPAASTSDTASLEPGTRPLPPASRPPLPAAPALDIERRAPAASGSAAPSAGSTLAQEVAAYEEAAALVSTQPGLAIVRLRAHREHFPGSALGEEVSLRLVQAFTALGRDADARREAAAFIARYPRSPKRAAMQTLAEGGIGHGE